MFLVLEYDFGGTRTRTRTRRVGTRTRTRTRGVRTRTRLVLEKVRTCPPLGSTISNLYWTHSLLKRDFCRKNSSYEGIQLKSFIYV